MIRVEETILLLLAAGRGLDAEVGCVNKRTDAFEHVDLVFLHQERNTVDVGLHDAVFAVYHLVHVHLQVAQLDAVLLEGGVSVVVVLGRVEEGFAGDAAHVEAGAA